MSVKLALGILRTDAPHQVQAVTTGTHLLPFTEEFFYTPTEMRDRAECETDPSFLQLLPYIVLQDEQGRVFRYFRGAAGNESRLHGNISIGVGGHMDEHPADKHFFGLAKLEAQREIEEEVGMAIDGDKIEFVSLIHNPTDVHAVHLGILGITKVNSAYAKIILEEGVIENGEFIDPATLTDDESQWARCEEWTKAALWYLGGGAGHVPYFISLTGP